MTKLQRVRRKTNAVLNFYTDRSVILPALRAERKAADQKIAELRKEIKWLKSPETNETGMEGCW